LAVTIFSDRYQRKAIDTIVAIDARGFLFGSALAYCLGTGIALVRKKGKLPYKTIAKTYELEYGEGCLEMHEDALTPGKKVVIIDDVLATGGTVHATTELVTQLGGEIIETCFLMELGFLNGRQKLAPHPVFSIIQY
jgi:adenine phosphoribosyltransferase